MTLLLITQMNIEENEMKSIENEDLCDCQVMPRHNTMNIKFIIMF